MQIKDKLFSLFFCLYLFWEPIACVIFGRNGLEMNGMFMRIFLVTIFILSILFYLIYKKTNQEIKVIGVLFFFGLMYYCTRFFYSYVSEGYQGQFLRWGADCVSACFIGMTLMKLKSYSTIHKILPLVCIALTPFLLVSTLENAMDYGQMSVEGGLNYQTVAYCLAYLFGFSSYYVLINKDSTPKIIKILCAVCLPFQSVGCCLSGGRGGVVLLVVYLIVLCYMLLRLKVIKMSGLVVIATLGVCLFLLIANYLHLWDAAGFARSSNLLNDDDRFVLWRNIWHYVTDNYFMGYGLGGAYYSFGFYTHNMFLDFIIEVGILGLVFLILVFVKLYKTIFSLLSRNDIFVILAIISLFGLVMNMFSGYWITTYTHWMILGVVMTYRTYWSK